MINRFLESHKKACAKNKFCCALRLSTLKFVDDTPDNVQEIDDSSDEDHLVQLGSAPNVVRRDLMQSVTAGGSAPISPPRPQPRQWDLTPSVAASSNAPFMLPRPRPQPRPRGPMPSVAAGSNTPVTLPHPHPQPHPRDLMPSVAIGSNMPITLPCPHPQPHPRNLMPSVAASGNAPIMLPRLHPQPNPTGRSGKEAYNYGVTLSHLLAMIFVMIHLIQVGRLLEIAQRNSGNSL